jgi:hypothetical protein
LVGEALNPAFGFVDRVAILLQCDVLRGEGETEIGEPPPIGPGPTGASRIAAALPEQERFEAMLRLRGQADGIFSCPYQVAQGFIVGGRI